MSKRGSSSSLMATNDLTNKLLTALSKKLDGMKSMIEWTQIP